MEMSQFLPINKINQKTGGRVTTEILEKEKPAGMPAGKKVAKRGGGAAGKVREATEKELKRSVISEDNYLDLKKETRKIKDQ